MDGKPEYLPGMAEFKSPVAPPAFLASSRSRNKVPPPIRRPQPSAAPTTDLVDNLAGMSLSPNASQTIPAMVASASPTSPRSEDDVAKELANLSLAQGTRSLRRKIDAPVDLGRSNFVPKAKSSKYGHETVKTLSLDDSIALADRAEPIEDDEDFENGRRRKPTEAYMKASKAANLFLGASFSSLFAAAFDDSDGEDDDLDDRRSMDDDDRGPGDRG